MFEVVIGQCYVAIMELYKLVFALKQRHISETDRHTDRQTETEIAEDRACLSIHSSICFCSNVMKVSQHSSKKDLRLKDEPGQPYNSARRQMSKFHRMG